MVNAVGEHLASLDGVEQRHLDYFKALGISGTAYVKCGAMGVAQIAVSGRLYEPVADGMAAAIMPVIGNADDTIDLLAWLPREPHRWWLRFDNALALGEDEIGRVRWSREPLHLVPTPLDWLRGGCLGACLLRDNAWADLMDIETVVVCSVDHGGLVQHALTPPPMPQPKILVRQQQVAA